MGIAFMTNPATGHCALFDEAPGGGDAADPSSLRNRPLADPANWLANLYFHTALDSCEVHSDTTVNVTHAAVAASTSDGLSNTNTSGFGDVGGGQNNNGVLRYNQGSTDRLLVTHSLGYRPYAFVVVGSNVLFPGMPVQVPAAGRGRYCTAYVTTTEVRLSEWSSVGSSGLAAISLDYRVLVIRQQRAASGVQLMDFDPATGFLSMGKDRFRSDRRYLQVVPGGSPFGIAYGKTMDLKNGAVRNVNPDGTTFETVPAGLKAKFIVSYVDARTPKTYDPGYGGSGTLMTYDGSYAGPTQIQVQAP